jgi:hypothetical protein
MDAEIRSLLNQFELLGGRVAKSKLALGALLSPDRYQTPPVRLPPGAPRWP